MMPALIITNRELTMLTQVLAKVVAVHPEWGAVLAKCQQAQKNQSEHIEEHIGEVVPGYVAPASLQEMRERYRFEDVADKLPRPWVYMDIGLLCGWLERFQAALLTRPASETH